MPCFKTFAKHCIDNRNVVGDKGSPCRRPVATSKERRLVIIIDNTTFWGIVNGFYEAYKIVITFTTLKCFKNKFPFEGVKSFAHVHE